MLSSKTLANLCVSSTWLCLMTPGSVIISWLIGLAVTDSYELTGLLAFASVYIPMYLMSAYTTYEEVKRVQKAKILKQPGLSDVEIFYGVRSCLLRYAPLAVVSLLSLAMAALIVREASDGAGYGFVYLFYLLPYFIVVFVITSATVEDCMKKKFFAQD